YEWDDLTNAAAHLSAVISLRDRIHLKMLRNAILGLALIQHRLGDSAAAERMLDEQLGFAELVPGPQYVGVIRSFRVHLALMRGRAGDAIRSMRTIDLDRLAPPDAFDMEVPALTEASVLTALGTEASMREALRK